MQAPESFAWMISSCFTIIIFNSKIKNYGTEKRTIGQSVYEVMTKYAGEVIAEMAGEIFTTRNFIEAFADKHEIIYVELLFAAYKNDRSRVFHRVHSQIGAYLSENQEKLDIKKTRRLMTRNPFGRENEVQEWRKKE